MKLVACPHCHAQYDVSGIAEETVACPCGAVIPAKPPVAVDAAVTRCAACGALVADGERTCSYCEATVTRQPAPTGPVCPECYARNPEGARHCTACGVAFLPQPIRKSVDPLECPICPGIRLAPRNLGGLWADECPMCLGLWAPGDVMDRLVDRVRERRKKDGDRAGERAHRDRRATWQGEVSYRRCPECQVAMQRKNFAHRSGVVVDWCGSHGTWLDADEMEDIAAFVLEGGLERVATDGKIGSSTLPADPAKAATLLAAEQLMADERARSLTRDPRWPFGSVRGLRGIADLLEALMK